MAPVRAVLPYDPAFPPGPRLGELPDPVAGPGEVLLEVRAAGLNRGDLLQLRGLYPPPPGESEVPGLECAGVVATSGEGVDGWRPGARAMALVAGGAQAERAAIPAGQLMELPSALGFAQGAAVPEAGLTAWTNLVAEGRLAPGETVVVTGATGGVGTFTVQLARELGARVVAAGRDRGRLEPLLDLGAHHVARLDDLPVEVRRLNDGRGADLVIDLVGGEHLGRALEALAPRGRLVLVGLMAGRTAPLDLGLVLGRRLRLVGSLLRPRPREEKAALVGAFAAFALPRLADGRLRAVVDRVLPLERAAEAYSALESGGVAGKVVLEIPC
jgi:putative PIG3 family NAD(P)H quinone oxidoreductase